MFDYYPEGWLIDTPENRAALQNISTLNDACRDGQILEGRALICDSAHNLLIDLGCMKGLIPREEGAIGIREGSVRDIAIISRVNRPVCFTISGFQKDQDGRMTALLSRRAAQEKCMADYISKLTPGDVINARVTHLESFGAFADIGCGIIALLPIDAISVSRIDHPRERFSVGMDIKVIVKSVENGRITLSHKELLGTWEENAAQFTVGETVAGIVRSVEPYGIFVELTPNLAGLAEAKEDVVPGQQASVYIKSIIPSRMKVKLVIIDTFDYSYRSSPPKYFFEGKRMDRFVYSPPGSEKEICTDFNVK
ncbi:S1 RNA-binding domain-containing protein [Caproiciproducens sp. LBM24188]|nr:S1 RNA-binding domain-containing protein [Oscillospiraceae bacterium]HHV31973.1 S1 RNA-binding domain-containing protein [Clostridiales bacterium]